MAMQSIHALTSSEPSCLLQPQNEEQKARSEDQEHISSLISGESNETSSKNTLSRLRHRWSATAEVEGHPHSGVHEGSKEAPAEQAAAAHDGNPTLSRVSTDSNGSSSGERQQQHPPLSQKRPSAAVVNANIYEELQKQQKQAKHAYLRMWQHARTVHARKQPRQTVRRKSASGGGELSNIPPDGFTPALGSSPVEGVSALPLPPSGLQLQHYQQQYAQAEQHLEQQQQEQHPSSNLDLPSLTVVVKMLLQSAALQAGPAAADSLRQQLLQQVKDSAAAARHAGKPFSVAAALQQALPSLRAAVKEQASGPYIKHVDTAAAAAAAGTSGEIGTGASTSGSWPTDATMDVLVHQGSRPHADAAVIGDGIGSNDNASAAASGIAAIEAALMEAACEVELEQLCLGGSANQVPAAADAQGSGTSSTCNLDLEQLLQSELAAAMAEEYSI